MDVAIVAQRIGATVIQQEDFHGRVDLEHVENWDSRHSLQPRILDLSFPHHLVSQHDLARQLGLAVQPEKKTLSCALLLLTLIVGETVQNCHEMKN